MTIKIFLMNKCKTIAVIFLIFISILSLAATDVSAASTVDIRVPGTRHYEYILPVYNGTNSLRRDAGVPLLELDTDLCTLAMQRAAECAVYYGHTRPNGESCFTVTVDSKNLGRGTKGENIAAGYISPEAATAGWRNSPGHYSNMIDTDYTRIGIGSFENNGKIFWVQLFANGKAYNSGRVTSSIKENNKIVSVSILTSMLSLNTEYDAPESITAAIGERVYLPKIYNKNLGLQSGSYTLLHPRIANSNTNAAAAAIESNFNCKFFIEGKEKGSGKITYSIYDGAESFAIPYTVVVPSIKIETSSFSLQTDKLSTLKASTIPSDADIKWNSSDTSVVSVSGGKVTAHKAGTATITAAMTVGKTTYTDTCKVTVEENPVPDENDPSAYDEEVFVTTGRATNISGNKATITGNASAKGANISEVRLLYGIDEKIMVMPYSSEVNGKSSLNFSHTLTNLAPETTYYYMASAIIDEEEYCGQIRSFTTEKRADNDLYHEDDNEYDDQDEYTEDERGSDYYEEKEPVAVNSSFGDVMLTAYYYDAVEWAVNNGIASGTGRSIFSPDTGCTRAQAVTFLWRAAGCPEPESSYCEFYDVDESAYYYDAVLWATENEITSGTSDSTFSPDTKCSRGQIVTFLYRAANSPSVKTYGTKFTDVSEGAYYYDAVFWAVENGITDGTGKFLFSPKDVCTRAQIVTFLYRTYK